MSDKRKVLAAKYLPSRLPITLSLVIWLVCDRVKVPQWLWGAAGLAVGIMWIAAVYGMIKEEWTEPEWKK